LAIKNTTLFLRDVHMWVLTVQFWCACVRARPCKPLCDYKNNP